jgi:hypothetical protein
MVSDEQITRRLTALRKKHGTVYAPLKYFRGLDKLSDVDARYIRIVGSRDGASYKPFATDKGVKTKTSSYTKSFYKVYPGATSLKSKSEVTGIPLSILQEVYRKGVAAWRTGHRPGATKEQWGYARVHSFIMMGKTASTADAYLVDKALSKMTQKNKRQWLSRR